MNEYGGYLLFFQDNQHLEQLKKQIDENRFFTDAISVFDWKGREYQELFLLAFDNDHIHYAALAKVGDRVVTLKHRIKFTNLISLDSLSFNEIAYILNQRAIDGILQQANYITSGIEKRFSPESWSQLIQVIKKLRSNCIEAFEELERKQKIQQKKTDSYAYQIVAQQKDTMGLALEIFRGERETELAKWKPPTQDKEEIPPFLEGLESANILEDKMIEHDAQVFGDWYKDPDKNYKIGVATFSKQDQRLSVMNVNRTPVEEALGVDLFYYHHQFQAYIMVQYKRLTLGGKEYRFRLPNPNNKEDSYNKQIKSMMDFETSYPVDNSSVKLLNEYRLYPGTFYFKLCQSLNFDPLSSDLIQGMYIPFDYWQILICSHQVKGIHGGINITKNNVGRYLNNTLFVQLAQAGWIGSKVGNKAILSEIIQTALAGKRSITLAVSQPK